MHNKKLQSDNHKFSGCFLYRPLMKSTKMKKVGWTRLSNLLSNENLGS